MRPDRRGPLSPMPHSQAQLEGRVQERYGLAEDQARRMAARAMGLQMQIFNANTKREIDAAFATMAREKTDGLFVGASPFLNGLRLQLVQLPASTDFRPPIQREVAEMLLARAD